MEKAVVSGAGNGVLRVIPCDISKLENCRKSSDKESRKKKKRADKTPNADENQEPGTNGEFRESSCDKSALDSSCDKSAVDTIRLEQNENEGLQGVVSDKESRKKRKRAEKEKESRKNGEQGVMLLTEETSCDKSALDTIRLEQNENEGSQGVVSDKESRKKKKRAEKESRKNGEQSVTLLREETSCNKSALNTIPLEQNENEGSQGVVSDKESRKKRKRAEKEKESRKNGEQGVMLLMEETSCDKSALDTIRLEQNENEGSQGVVSDKESRKKKKRAEKEKEKESRKNGEQSVMLVMEETSCNKSALNTIPLEQNENEGSQGVVSDKESRKKKKRADKTPNADKNQEPATNGELRVIPSYEEVVSVKERKKKSRKVSFGGAAVLGPKENCQKQASENLEDSVEQEECISPKDEPIIESPSEEVPFRFSKEEDAIITKEFMNYIEGKGWDLEEGLHNIFEKRQSCVHNIWDEMVIALPHRSKKSIANRARRVLTNTKRGPWSQEEVDLLFKLHEVHGNNWLAISKEIGRHRKDARLKWRYTKDRKNKGAWTQEELEKLAAVVHRCYEVKSKLKDTGASLNKAGLRDGLSWESIAKEVGTRPYSTCIIKWYRDLRSSMVATGDWADNDDQILLKRLLDGEATDEEAVDWERLVENRSGLTCQKRWKQMVKTLGEQRAPLDFESKLELVTRRFAPTLLRGHEDIPEASDD